MGKKGSARMPPKAPTEEKEPEFIVHCLGRKMAHLDLRCAFESEILHDSLLDMELERSLEDSDSPCGWNYRDIGFPLEIESPKHIVGMVNDFCVGRATIMKTHKDDPAILVLEKLKVFDSEFVLQKPLSILFLLLNAAIQLRIKSLMNLVRNAIADLHDGEFAVKVPDYIKKSEVVYVDDSWTMDGIPEIPFEFPAKPAKKQKLSRETIGRRAPRRRY